jgi:hypothetical protein
MDSKIRPSTLKRYDAILKLIESGETVLRACKRHRMHPSHYYLLKKKVKPLVHRTEKDGTLVEVRSETDVVMSRKDERTLCILRGVSPELLTRIIRDMM